MATEPNGVMPDIRFKPVPGAPAGTSGEVKVTVSAKDVSPASTTFAVTIGEGVDLAAGPPVELSSTPGADLAPPLQVGNVGDTTAHGAVAVFYGDYAFAVSKQHSNCTYSEGRLTSCTFTEDLLADKTYVTKEPLPLKLRPDTEAPGSEWLEIAWVTPAEFEILKKEIARSNPGWFGTPGTGSRLELVEKASIDRAGQVDLDPTNNWTQITVQVTGDNPADLAAIGGSASGAAGTVVPLDLGLKNLGPATIDHGRSGEPTSQVNIQLPPGSSLTEMPEGCVALGGNGQPDHSNPGNLAARGIACWPAGYLFIAGTQATFPVKLRIDEATANATGKVMVVTPYCEDNCDPNYNESNNNADIALNASVSLPVTGVQVGLLVGTGTLLLVAGIALFVLARRRRFNLSAS
ncbi:hypothetical protein [Allorhizocola rhizosphaerae]|uniref:hypothetical protein n=1 Tax=Allorhizocola rhizosphaerae TaxID=1872709 RepID=UPI000E3DB08A|nr:hypothetical protein [Allorhizocola rhizosphaerae]